MPIDRVKTATPRLTVASQGGLTCALSDVNPYVGCDDVLNELRAGRYALARDLASALLASGSEADLATAITAYAVSAWHQGRLTDACSILSAVVARPPYRQAPVGDLVAHLTLAYLLIRVGEFTAATRLILGVAARRHDGGREVVAETACAIAALRLAQGSLTRASAAARQGIKMAGPERYLIGRAELVLAVVDLEMGDLDGAKAHLTRCETELPAGRSMRHGIWLLTVTERISVGGGSADAFDRLSAVYDSQTELAHLLVADPRAAAFLVRSALAVGRIHQAVIVAVAAEMLAAQNERFSTLAASALHARGLLEDDATLLRSAADLYRHPRLRASALEDVGTITAKTDSSAARSAWQQALSGYRAVRSELGADRVERRLRDGGAASHRRPKAPEGWDSLTDAELRVVDGVAQGFTNREVAARLFVSRHTIDFHLRSIYRKMSVHSRVQLARLVDSRPRWR
jgi:ATP/maltotriose-dependent transcriptional regulator MalT